MKLCFIMPHFYPHVGGAEQAIMDIACEFVKKGIKVRVITCKDESPVEKINYKGIEIYYYDWKKIFGHPLPKNKDLKQHILWADVVHSAVYSVVPNTSKLCKKYKKPHVCTVHEVLRNKWYWIEHNPIKATLFRLYEKYTVSHYADLFVVPSTATLNDLKKANNKCVVKKIFWISEFNTKKVKMDRNKFNKYFGTKNDDIIFLNYGRPGKTKGLFIYLNAIKKAFKETDRKNTKKIKFCFIMGNDPISERNKFIKLVNKYNLSKNIIIKESVSREDLNTYRMCADYIVVPSITEGFGLSAIEACEFNKKLVYSSAGSLPEVTFGNVVEFKNRDISNLAKILKSIIQGENIFEKKEKKDFSKKTISNEFIATYNSLIKKYK